MVAAAAPDEFAPYLARWQLEPDGAAFATRTSRLLPVRSGSRSGLSAAWYLGEGRSPTIDLAVAELATAELDR